MPKRKEMKELPEIIKKPRIILYDDKEIQYITGDMASMDYEPQFITYEHMDGSKTTFPLNAIVTLSVDNMECLENIKLDKTLMERIAVFNKEQQCKRLDKDIREKREEIKRIEEILEDRERRLAKLKNFITHIYEIDVTDDDWDD